MNMTPDQMKQVIEKLDTIWPKPRVCPICQSKNWKLHSRLYLHQTLHGTSATASTVPGHFNVHQEGLPAILAWCENCGYVATFMADKFGIAPDLVKEQKKAPIE